MTKTTTKIKIMKKTLIALLTLGSVALADQNVTYTGTGENQLTWEGTLGGIEYTKALNPSTPQNWLSDAYNTPNITGGGFHAGNYTVSMWLDSSSLTSVTDTKMLFAYSGAYSGVTNPAYNGVVWNGADKTLSIGRGTFTASNMSFVFWNSDYRTTQSITLGNSELVNITLAVQGANQSQIASVYVNGTLIQTLDSYNGNMNNGTESTVMRTYLNNSNFSYGEVTLANELKDAQGVVAMMGLTEKPVVPEPTTGTLSLLALAGLCARRRKK